MRIEPGTLQAGRPVLVLVSGGRDSTCLLGLAAEVCGAGAVRGLHVDYGLREDSGEDAAHCLALGERLGVPVTVHGAGDVPRAGNLQAWARDLRYGVALREARGSDVAVGHTATDQAETVLYRLASSPGRRALLGMAPRSGRLVRPLLGVTREETAEWCREHGLAWREDPTNATDAFARGRVRHGLVPALEAVHPAAQANVVRTAQLLRDEAAVLDDAVAGLLRGRREVPLSELRAAPPALARLAVVRLAEDAAGALVPRAGARTADLLALGDEAALDIGDGVRAQVRGGRLRFEAV